MYLARFLFVVATCAFVSHGAAAWEDAAVVRLLDSKPISNAEANRRDPQASTTVSTAPTTKFEQVEPLNGIVTEQEEYPADTNLETSHLRALQSFTGGIVKFELIDARKNIKLMDLANGTVIQSDKPAFSVRAALNGTGTRSVQFGHNNLQRYRVEHVEPFAFCGNNGTDYRTCDALGYGTHTITATPFSGRSARGQSGTPLTITFQVLACPSVESYINGITLSGRRLSLSGTTTEDKALKWLVADDPLKLTPCSDADKFRLRQRFALLTLGLQALFTGEDVVTTNGWFGRSADECKWDRGISCGDATGTRVTTFQWQLRGASIPTDFALLDSMTSFAAFDYFVGTLPTTLGAWTNLDRFEATSNLLDGTLPSEISSWSNLRFFLISRNQFTGTLPSSIGAWSKLEVFDVGIGNRFVGTLPTTLGAWSRLRVFAVTGNKFRGTIPSYVANWTAIRSVFLMDNDFTGTVPPFVDGFCPKQTLDDTSLYADCGTSVFIKKREVRCDCCDDCYVDRFP